MKFTTTQLLIHITGCIIFLTLPVFFAPHHMSLAEIMSDYRTLHEFMPFVFMVAFFYIHYYLIVPNLYFPKKYGLYLLAVLGCYLFIAVSSEFIIPFEGPAHRTHAFPSGRNQLMYLFTHNLFLFLVVLLFSLMLCISDQWRKTQREKLNAELSYLKAQINPHFLFNTLNSIYSLALDKSENTAPAVVKLSNMMRYVLSEANKDFVSLEKELAYIQNYIELKRIRFGNSIKLNVDVKGNTAGKKIAPLILIPFIENAFKHGVNAEENSDISIQISTQDNAIWLDVSNLKVNIERIEQNEDGLGIANTRNRLLWTYPGKHELLILDTEKDFTVRLHITL